MKKAKILLSYFLISVFSFGACSQDVEVAQKDKFHLYLLAGQSNMAGRGMVESQDREIHDRVLTLRKNGTWGHAIEPIHFDKRSAGVGPGRSFGIAMAEKDPSVTIGLIPCAVGGSSVTFWKAGKMYPATNSYPYDDTIERVKRAMKDGTLKGIIWHQGESDATPTGSENYEGELSELFLRFRAEFKNPDLPILVGQLGQFESRPWDDSWTKIDAAHRSVADAGPSIVFVTSDGLTCKPDNVHFDSASMRAFGKRYAEAYGKLISE